MAMGNTLEDLTFVVDNIETTVEISQLAALATKLGLTAIVEPDPDAPAYRVRFGVADDLDGTQALMALTVLVTYSRGWTGNDIVDFLRGRLDTFHYPMDRPMQDVMEVGGGPEHEGHDG